MNREFLEKLAQQGESETLEFKKSTAQLKSIGETLCAFLNHQGGSVLVGVDDKGQLLGQDVTDNTRQEIAKEIAKIEPTVHIHTHYLPVENGKTVILLTVPVGQFIPYAYEGRAFQRIQSTTSRMSQHRYEELLIQRAHLNYAWDKALSQTYTLSDLDQALIKQFISAGVERGRLPYDAMLLPIETALMQLGLIIDHQLTNAAVVLFAKAISSDYLQCQLKLARFQGTSKLDDFLDNQQLYGNIFELLKEAENFIKRHLPIASSFSEQRLTRTDKPAVPTYALREALVNAFCHKDYQAPTSFVALAIYDDRLELWNKGLLPPGMELTELKRPHQSNPRNRLLAKTLYAGGYIETWGRGTNHMVETCLEQGLPEPEFEQYSGGIAVVFKFQQAMRTPIVKTQAIYPKMDLTKRQLKVLELLSQESEMSVVEISRKLENPPALRTLGDDLAVLKKQKLVEVIGHGRGARWYLIKNSS